MKVLAKILPLTPGLRAVEDQVYLLLTRLNPPVLHKGKYLFILLIRYRHLRLEHIVREFIASLQGLSYQCGEELLLGHLLPCLQGYEGLKPLKPLLICLTKLDRGRQGNLRMRGIIVF